MLRMCVVAAATLIFPSLSFAQSPDTWSGFSVAIGGGASKVDTDALADTSVSNDLGLGFPVIIPPFFGRVDVLIDGQADNSNQFGDDEWAGFGTIQAGYDQRFGKFLIGAFVDFDFYPEEASSRGSGNLNGAVSGSAVVTDFIANTQTPIPLFGPAPINGYASYSANVELDKVWTIGGKLGYLLNEHTLLYALGGYSEASIDGDVTLSFNTFIPPGGPQTLNVGLSDELHGYVLGGGGEYKFTDNLALRLEYRYAKYQSSKSSTSYNNDVSIGDNIAYLSLEETASLSTNIEAEIHSVRAALVMKLGMP